MSQPLAYYNEIDPDAALILHALIADGVIAPGEVDTRSITEVQPDDLIGFTQCHFFAGGGLWSVAARMAGWDDARPLWTGSCPCQPFSVAGKGAGTDDARHLWPDLLRLASARRPPVLVGEQVAGKAGYGWFDGVRADLAGENYASRYVDIPACAVDAPHIRQRGYWVALDLADTPDEAEGRGLLQRSGEGSGSVDEWASGEFAGPHGGRFAVANPDGQAGARGRKQDQRVRSAFDAGASQGVPLGYAIGARLEGQRRHGNRASGRAVEDRPVAAADGGSGYGNLGDADRGRASARPGDDGEMCSLPQAQCEPERRAALSWGANHPRRNGSFWSDHEWISCHDGKARRSQPGVPLLVDGLPGRVGLWRVAGNAISPVLAAEVLGALMDELDEQAILGTAPKFAQGDLSA